MSGPYAWTRNPLYLGTLLVAIGLVVSTRELGLAALFAAAFGLVYLPAIELEEQHLRSLFPEYGDYAQRVPRLGAKAPGEPPARKTFQLALYRKNQEYQAAAGYLIGLALLVWKVLRLTSFQRLQPERVQLFALHFLTARHHCGRVFRYGEKSSTQCVRLQTPGTPPAPVAGSVVTSCPSSKPSSRTTAATATHPENSRIFSARAVRTVPG